MPHISESAPLQISRFYTGLYTYRNPLIVPIRQFGRRIIELYDAISDGLNMEPSNRLTLIRRPGYTAYNSNPVNGTPLWFYSFKPATMPGQIYTLVDTSVDIEWIQPGAIPPIVLYTKTTPAMTTFSQVGAYNYWAGENFMLKWDSPAGAQGVTNWGIDINAADSHQGPHTFAQINNLPLQQLTPNIPPAPAWGTAGPGSVTLPAASSPANPTVSQFMLLEQYGFGPPIVTPPPPYITGVAVTLTGVDSGGAGTYFKVFLAENNATIGNPKKVTLPTNSATVTIGGPSDLWGTNIQPADVLSLTFGAAVQAVNASNAATTYTVTNVQLTVYWQTGPALALVGGLITAEVGYQYVYTYGNSYSGHISSPTFPSVNGTTTNNPAWPLIVPTAQNVQVYASVSPDPQVTNIHFYRTTDGGGMPFFELPNSPIPNVVNSNFGGTPTAMIVDSAQDWQLQIAEIAPLPHFNDPPPMGATDPVWYGGRLWLHKDNNLFFSSGPDITQGNPQEAWFPAYVFEIPNAQIVRKFPTPNGMLVVTNDQILIVRGISTASFTVNDFMLDTGMRTWTAGDTDGTNIYLYTSDKQCLLINANGITSVSQNIADTIQVVDPALAYLSIYRYGALQNWIMLSDGSTFIYPYNVELQAWATKAKPVGGVMALATVETQPGFWELWRGIPAPNSIISFRDPTVWTDRGVTYPCFVVFGPLTVADFLTVAQVRDVVISLAPTDTRFLTSVIANEVMAFTDRPYQIMEWTSTEPPELSETPSRSFRNYRYTWKSTPLPENINFAFLRLDFDAVPNPDEIWNWTVGGSQTTGGSALGPPGQLPQIQGR